jgi:glucokinase
MIGVTGPESSARHRSSEEGGHGDFAATNPSEINLSYLPSKFEHVSQERICSGRGMYNIYKYFHKSGHSHTIGCPAEDKISEAGDPTRLSS